jgi:hypothetical protein
LAIKVRKWLIGGFPGMVFVSNTQVDVGIAASNSNVYVSMSHCPSFSLSLLLSISFFSTTHWSFKLVVDGDLCCQFACPCDIAVLIPVCVFVCVSQVRLWSYLVAEMVFQVSFQYQCNNLNKSTPRCGVFEYVLLIAVAWALLGVGVVVV